MVCHCNLLARDSSVLSKKNWTSSGNRRPCTKLWATHLLSPWAHVLTLADTGRGLLPSLKVACQPASNREEDAMLAPTWAVGSQIVIPPDTQGGVLKGASSELTGGCLAVRCLFWERPGGGGGGVGSLPRGSCYCEAGRVLGTKQPMLIIRLVTISSSPGSDLAPEECIDSTATSSATWTGAGSSSLSTSWWTTWFLETISAEVSLMGSKDLALTKRGPRSWVSPTIKEEGVDTPFCNLYLTSHGG